MQSLDFIVIGLYAILILGVGLYYSRKTKTTEDYMLGGRRMKPWMVGMSLFATMLSAIFYLMVPNIFFDRINGRFFFLVFHIPKCFSQIQPNLIS